MKKIFMTVTIMLLILELFAGCSERNENTALPSVPKQYSYDDDIKESDVIDLHGKVSNIDKLDNFIDNVNKGKPDKVGITKYTIEGDPILYTLEYDGNTIEYTVDTSRDSFGGEDKGINKFKYTKIWKEDSQIDLGENRKVDGISYFLANNKGEKTEVITIRKSSS